MSTVVLVTSKPDSHFNVTKKLFIIAVCTCNVTD